MMTRKFRKVLFFIGLALVGLLLGILTQPLMAVESHNIINSDITVSGPNITDITKIGPLKPPTLEDFRTPTPPNLGAGGLKAVDTIVPGTASLAEPTELAESWSANTNLIDSQRLYESGQWQEAIALLQQAIDTAIQTGDTPAQLTALRNLALVQQQLRQFDAASQSIDQAFGVWDAHPDLAHRTMIRASLLDIQGSIAFGQGNADEALNHWQTAADLYDDAGAMEDALQTRVNQAQALQTLGFYRQAIALLTPIIEQWRGQEDTVRHAIALRSLGDALRFVGSLDESRSTLEASLEMGNRLQRSDLTEPARLSWANTVQAQGAQDTALRTYQSLSTSAASGELQLQALSNQISLLLDMGQTDQAKALWPDLAQSFNTLPPNQTVIFAKVNGAKRFIDLGTLHQPSRQDLAKLLAIAIQEAQMLGDRRSESYAVGTLGRLYERSHRLEDAQQLSEQALTLAQQANATDISYLWHWQLGRIYKAQGDRQGLAKEWGLKQGGDRALPQAQPQTDYDRAIAAYSDAVDTLKTLRTDLVAVNAQVQVSFQDSVEPIHRELVSLLLDEQRRNPSVADIEQARTVIEALQLAELDNFFREACLDRQPMEIDQLDPTAAVLYPIMLGDRLETVVSLPNRELHHYSSPVARRDVERLVAELRQHLTLRIGSRFRPGMSKLYDWVIRPLESELKDANIKTLVFVLDGALRNIPMAALYDGKSFLIETYSVAVTPGLELVNPQPLQAERLGVLTGALSESRQGFSALPNVVPEVEQIQSTVPAQVLFNEAFTQESFQSALARNAEPIVHLASHGSFSSNKDRTFILTWDGQLKIDTLNASLQGAELNQQGPIELLVLSACQTAAGDKEAALGLAGMAVRAGARSTIATLWTVNDEATALLMKQFYESLSNRKLSKAAALRQAQLKILQDPLFRQRPYYWAPYILVGNWL